jgi:hypothetical protein
MPYPNAKLIHIYGFTVDENETPEIKSPAKLFKLPFYGSTSYTDDDKLHYVGMQIGTSVNPFDRLYATQTGDFQMVNVIPSSDVISTMKKLYPRKELKCHSFLAEIYTSHYYDGTIMIGYFFSPNTDLNDEDAEEVDPCDLELSEIVEDDTTSTTNVEIIHVGHNLQNGFGSYFIGKQLSSDFTNFEFSHEDEPGSKFYQMCREIHQIEDYNDFNLEFKDGYLSTHKMIAFVPSMCYCCT